MRIEKTEKQLWLLGSVTQISLAETWTVQTSNIALQTVIWLPHRVTVVSSVLSRSSWELWHDIGYITPGRIQPRQRVLHSGQNNRHITEKTT
jgi:hypothetical protein